MKTLAITTLLSAALLFSFARPPKKPVTLKEFQKALKLGYVYVPGGKTVLEKDTVECQGFFMSKGEITNFNYLEYLSHLRKTASSEEYTAALPDTTKWDTPNNLSSKMAEHYFRHPAYRDYPVVNLTRQQAENYCKWLTQVWRKNTGNEGIEFRIPARTEFLRASNGTDLRRPYAWTGPYFTRNDGRYQCNSIILGAGAITRDTANGGFKVMQNHFFDYASEGDYDYSDLTSPAISFWPNEFGLYNLNGNVAEMISDGNYAVGGSWNSPGYDVRNESIVNFSQASPTVGFRPVMTFVEK